MNERKGLALLLLFLSLISLYVVWETNQYVNAVQKEECRCVGTCPMSKDISIPVILGAAVSLTLALFGLHLLRTTPLQSPNIDLSSLKPDEKKIMELLLSEKALFQGDIVEKTGFSKSKVSRTLDTLEGKGLAARRRRGMSNMVILKTD